MRTYTLSGGHNFRDMGGYPATAGKSVAWGRLFRSGTLANLTDEDHDTIETLDIRFICDLRTTRERSNYPTRWLAEHAAEFWSRDYDMSDANLYAAVNSPDGNTAEVRETMLRLYRTLPYEQAASYSELLKRIAAGHVPVLFHCSAGKDRTGVFGALILDLLGVDRDVTIADYVLTDEHYDNLFAMFLRDRKLHDIESIDPVLIDPLLRADADYIEAMFAEVERRHGSTEAYAIEALGITPAEIAQIRAALLV